MDAERREVKDDGMQGNEGERVCMWLEDKRESLGDWLIEGGEVGMVRVLVGCGRRTV